jgi:hypothetical protein
MSGSTRVTKRVDSDWNGTSHVRVESLDQLVSIASHNHAVNAMMAVTPGTADAHVVANVKP